MKRKITNKKGILIAVLFAIISINLIHAQNFGGGYTSGFTGGYRVIGASANPQFTNPNFYGVSGFTTPETYWPKFEKEDCLERQDFIMQIAPGGCSPSVVRSDLLEEGPVPVFCKVMSIQVNPLIDVSKIRSLRFPKKQFSEGVSGVSYYPARAGLRSYDSLVSSPIDDNLGYLVIVLRQTESEDDMPDFVEGNITAVIDYDVEGAFGIGETDFYVSELDDEEWLRDYQNYGIWNGKAYVKAESIEDDRATISIYRDNTERETSVTLRKGETSRDIYLGGFYCAAGMQITLKSIESPIETALIQVDDQQIWVAKGDRILNGRCSITEVDAYHGGGKVSVNCPVKDGRFDLSLSPGKAELKYEEYTGKYSVGEQIRKQQEITTSEKSGIWVAYIGRDYNNQDFVVLVKDESVLETEYANREIYSVIDNIVNAKQNRQTPISNDALQKNIISRVKTQYDRAFRTNTGARTNSKEVQVEILTKGKESTFVGSGGDSNSKVSFVDSLILKNKEWDTETDVNAKLAKEYYDKAIENYKDLADFYPDEKRLDSNNAFEPYSVEGLYNAAELSDTFGMYETANELYTRVLKEYPESAYAIQAYRAKQNLVKYDSGDSKVAVNINNRVYLIDLLAFNKPKKEDVSVDVMIGDKVENLGVDEIYPINKDGSLQVMKINRDYVELRYVKAKGEVVEEKKADDSVNGNGDKNGATTTPPTSSSSISSSRTIRLDLERRTQEEVDKIRVKLVNINLKEQVRLHIEPKKFGPRTESDFSFKIGIEKRGIKLSPEKTQEKMQDIMETIEKWEDINKKLGNIVQGMKGACFATSAMLTVKNLFSGWSGESMARNQIMTDAGGWNDKCEEIVSNKLENYESVQACIFGKEKEINADVEKLKIAIESENKRIKEIQNGLPESAKSKGGFFGEDSINPEAMRKAYYDKVFKDYYNTHQNDEIKLSDGSEATLKEIVGENPDKIPLDFMKNIMLKNRIGTPGENSALGILDNQIGKDGLYFYQTNQYHKETDELTSTFEGVKVYQEDEKNQKIMEMTPITNSIKGTYEFNSGVDMVFSDYATINNQRTKVIVGLDKQGEGYKVIEVKNENGDEVESGKTKYMDKTFIQADSKAYENKMLNPNILKVKYFEQAPFKELPAEVPFDIENGWYVKMNYVISGFGVPYDESGRVRNYYICNVGSNGKIEFKQSSDDICRYYNGDSNAELGFPGMTASESRRLVSRAQQAIAEAGRQYGKKIVKIGGYTFESAISFDGGEGKCTDFMPPGDCKVLFNVCDPVICPASRCDLGGAYRVDNVIQSGIIGSLVLCLPNMNEGIAVPICLSGVHAGIEGYLSILKSTKACLNESLETGRNIGICDEIKSVYMCQFFWKQLTPFLDVLIPKLIGGLYTGGQGTRGGGEYLTVQSAWDNTKSAIDYFKNDYAVNSMQAFNKRSTQEIGDDICKSFMSVNVPKGNFFDVLTEPDSPEQYTAWFSEDVLTTATIPATSHYKVYYHIYAGKDQGAYYTVYLKDLPDSSYIHTLGSYVVDRGYIQRGQEVDVSRDFTGVAGYKQLCVSINGQDKCGFGKVSTSYAINSIADQYAKEQAKQTQITKEEECVAGTASAQSLLQPNLQAGVEEAIQPELYNHGIIRVCSTQNPGKQVTPQGEFDTTATTYDKWKAVGYCDDPTIKCWLDTGSVKNVIKDKNIETDVLNQVDLTLIDQEEFLDAKQSQALASEGEKFVMGDGAGVKTLEGIEKGSVSSEGEEEIDSMVRKLEDLALRGATNSHRARGLFLLGKLYHEVAVGVLGEKVKGVRTTVSEEDGIKTIENLKKNEDKKKSGDIDKEVEDYYEFGYEMAQKYQENKIRDYELVLQYKSISSSSRQEFLSGFKKAYVDIREDNKGKEYSSIIEDAYQYIEIGEKIGLLHGNNRIRDEDAQNAIENSITGTTKSYKLGWKVGYIRGFAETYEGKDDPINEGIAMYNALRAVYGL